MKFLAKIVNHSKGSMIILRNMDLNTIRLHFGRDRLAPIEAFILDGYHEKLYSNLSLDQESNVVILGGYKGASAIYLNTKYCSNVFVVEPLPRFAEILKDKLTDSKFKIFEFAISDGNGEIEIGIVGEKSGIRANSSQFFVASCRKASEFLTELSSDIDLLEMNIEGSEYMVLHELIESRVILSIRCLLVQFHGDSIKDELSRSILRQKLSETHICIFNYPWVWERWDIRK